MRIADARARTLAGARMAGGSASVPITNGMMSGGGGALSFAPLGQEAQHPATASAGPASAGNGHNTALHTGLIVLAAGGVIAALHLGGFRIAFDVGMGR